MSTVAHDEEAHVLEQARLAFLAFAWVFAKRLADSSYAEICAARELGLYFPEGVNTKGYDAVSDTGERYQIKYRAVISIIDVTNFDFDYLVLVNLDADFHVSGIWRASRAQVQGFFTEREKYRRHQIGQPIFKQIAERVR